MIPDAAARAAVERRFERFAADEAPGRSALYERWAAGVARDAACADVLARIPETRRQPPLVFAVSRMLDAPEEDYPTWRDWVLAHADLLVAEVTRRSLQTNEPQRCAALLPALSLVDGPIALLEIGVSAGLCLYPDRYSYRYDGGASLDPHDGPSPVVLESAISGAPRLRLPEVVWRAGIDLAPLDARDAGDRRFLTSLVWPGEHGRAARIEAALDIAAADPPLLFAGDASDQRVLTDAVAAAPSDATLVVTLPGVLPHIPRAGRERLLATLGRLDVEWISIDPPWMHEGKHPTVESKADFVLTRRGEPVAFVDPLGAFVEWRAGAAADAG